MQIWLGFYLEILEIIQNIRMLEGSLDMTNFLLSPNYSLLHLADKVEVELQANYNSPYHVGEHC